MQQPENMEPTKAGFFSAPAWVVAVDIGGTHITSAAVDLSARRLEESSRANMAVDACGSATKILDTWCEALRSTRETIPDDSALLGYGVAMPGPFDYDAGIILVKGLGKYESLYGMNIRAAFRVALAIPANQPVIFRNDAVCFLLGESFKGAAVGHQDVIGITLGTGLGSAFMRHGEIVHQDPGLPPSGWFYNVPFKNGIADDYLSSRGLLASYQSRGGQPVNSVLELSQRAVREKLAQDVFIGFGKDLAEFLQPWLRAFAPTCLVIGGGISRAWEWFGSVVLDRLHKKVPAVVVKRSSLLEDANLLGAALLPSRYEEPAASGGHR